MGFDKHCSRVFQVGKDHVFISTKLESQRDISLILNEHIPKTLRSTSLVDNDFCYDNVIEIICKYYMSPCGNESSKQLPRSICLEDCFTVERDCPTTWKTVAQSLKRYQFINCNRTTTNIFPIPSCCNGIIIQKATPAKSTPMFCLSCDFRVPLQMMMIFSLCIPWFLW